MTEKLKSLRILLESWLINDWIDEHVGVKLAIINLQSSWHNSILYIRATSKNFKSKILQNCSHQTLLVVIFPSTCWKRDASINGRLKDTKKSSHRFLLCHLKGMYEKSCLNFNTHNVYSNSISRNQHAA